MIAPIQTVGIVGAGLMGRAIAAECVRAGYRVLLFDADSQVARDAAREIAATRRGDGEPSGPQGEAHSPMVANCLAEIAGADLVIEAVPENLTTKITVLSGISPYLGDQTLLATNTSSIPIGELASTVSDSARLCGLHFCHPVAQRRLVEVVSARTTSRQTIRRACQFAESLGKSPVVVQDGPGFVLNRVLSPYLTESLELLLEGATVEMVDEVSQSFGMPYGPLRQLDEFGLDVALAVGGTLLRAWPNRFIASELLIALHKSKRQGRKSSSGFYVDDGDSRRDRLDPAAETIILDRRRDTRQPTTQEVQLRMLLPMLMEAARVVEEGLVDSPETVDVILRDGLGTTPESHGLFGWACEAGVDRILEWSQSLAPLGQRFEPTPNVRSILTRQACPSPP